MEYKKVEGRPDLVRDLSNGAIINNDSSSYQNYILMRDKKLKEMQRIDKLENEVGEIKSLLQQLIDKL